MTTPEGLSTTKRALLALKEANAKLQAWERTKYEKIAVVGLGCRFPGDAIGPDAYWDLLDRGGDAITEVPQERWDIDALFDPDPMAPGKMISRYGGFLSGIDQFDPQFWNLSPREAKSLDPQQRLLLEVAWEALEHAGQAPERLFGHATGVFLGMSNFDFALRMGKTVPPDELGVYFGTGSALSVNAGRLSYALGLTGPSLVVDTACSSSLVSLHLACQSLRQGECDLALAGGVNVILAPETSISFSKAGLLSPDGRCKTFDGRANGYVRGEGCGVVVLKRLSDALEDGDRILASISSSAVNQDGPSGGLTVPSGPSQEKVIREALANGRVDPEELDYIEAHGTGTSLGDPIEVEALGRIFGQTHDRHRPLLLGSVKTNIGHLEAAAGIAGVIKVVLALNQEKIPRHLHFSEPNPHIPWQDLPFAVPQEPVEWKRGSKPRRAAVSSFGFSGTNAHVLLEEAPAVEARNQPPEPLPAKPGRAHLLTLSARNPNALGDLAGRYGDHLRRAKDEDLGDICYTSHVGRSHFEHRLSAVGDSACGLGEALAAFAAQTEPSAPGTAVSLMEGRLERAQVAEQPVFLFTGEGDRYPGMGRELFDTQPAFRQTLQQCDEILKPLLAKSLLDVLFGAVEEEALRHQPAWTQPAMFCFEYALAQVWRSWGIQPAAVLGYGLGEVAAACVAGVFDLEGALTLVAERGRRIQELPRNGTMMAVSAPRDTLTEVLAPWDGQVAVAVDNGSSGVVLSGQSAAMTEVVERLAGLSVDSHPLNVSHAFHSPLMDPILEDLGRAAAALPASMPKIPLLSSRTGTFAGEEILSADYWVAQLRDPVRFAACLETLAAENHRIFLELGPRPMLMSAARCILDQETDLVWLSSLTEERSDGHSMLRSLGTLYTRGAEIDWNNLAGELPRSRVTLPTYPFQRSRYWISPPPAPVTDAESVSVRSPDKDTQPMGNAATTSNLESSVNVHRRAKTLEKVSALFCHLLQFEPEALDPRIPFLELGADSLILIEAVQTIQKDYGVKVTIRQILEELQTVEDLANYIADHLPEEKLSTEAAPSAPAPSAPVPAPSAPAPEEQPVAESVAAEPERRQAATASRPTEAVEGPRSTLPAASPPSVGPGPSLPTPVAAVPKTVSPAVVSPAAGSPVVGSAARQIMEQQLQVMSKLMSDQLMTLSRVKAVSGPVAAPVPASILAPAPAPAPTSAPAPASAPATSQAAGKASSPFSSTISEARARDLSPQQQAFLDALIERYCTRTERSKQRAREHRAVWADVRSSILFRAETKEIAYPILGEESAGAHFWDVDGNEYVDVAMGFGVNLFGHNPAFIREALEERLQLGIQVGPESHLAGDVATLIHQLTGVERVTFCNSGTEAVMTAIRIARAATGRTKVAMFSGSYHGHSDQTMVLGKKVAGKYSTQPMTLGVPGAVAEEALVLAYDDPESLKILQQSRHELAAVLVEPVQSREPGLQPKDFLRQLRQFTEDAGIALVFDEVLLGFRIGPGGAQEWCGVEADIVTYGKVVGGGLPIGVIAGKAAFMDTVDGGVWAFGDDSGPTVGTTFVAGTFSKHPLALTASRAVLKRLQSEGPALQNTLNRRTTALAAAVNQFAETYDFPIRVDSFGSLFRLTLAGNTTYFYQPLEIDLLFYNLIERGVYTWEGRTCYLSTAHTQQDIDHIVWAIQDSLLALREGGFWAATKEVPAVAARARRSVPYREPPSETRRRAGDARSRQESTSPPLEDTYESMPPAALDPAARARIAAQERGMQFSLSFFGNYSPEFREDKYDLIFRGARFADQRGFTSVWVPERHFHEFGGFSPNPSVVAGALAKATRRIGLRAGSVVLPLHHPLRVAEEWSVVDNISQGRVGVSFAAGWHPNDFVFAPDHFGQQREVMFERIEEVQKLWSGTGSAYTNGAGESAHLELHPRPMQTRLPIWLTIVRNPEMYKKAGELGAGILTNLMGQTLDELEANIALYRSSLAEHGFDPASGHVSVLLHTYVTDDAERAREQARAPFCAYLKSSLGLFKGLLRTQDLNVEIDALSEEDLDSLVSAAYSRYVETAALIGSEASTGHIVDRLLEVGVDEAACFVDFGVAPDLVLANLPHLDALRLRYQDGRGREATVASPGEHGQRVARSVS